MSETIRKSLSVTLHMLLAGIVRRYSKRRRPGVALPLSRSDVINPEVPAFEFAQHLIHELNNAFSVVMSGSELLERASSPEASRAAAMSIVAAAQDGLDLTARFSALAGYESSGPVPCDIAGTLAAMRPRLERAAGGTERLRLELSNHGLPVLIDRDRFLVCLTELVMDARLHSDGGVVVVHTHRGEAAPRSAGLSASVVVSVTAADTAGRRGAGSASALSSACCAAIARSLAERFAGSFEQDQVGGLRRATLRFPLIQAKAFANDVVRPALGRTGRAGARAAKVVVVEDNEILRGSLVGSLREQGLDVADARDAAAALKLLAGAAVLITDVVMPGEMDGFSLAKWARERDPGIALLFVSAFMSARLPDVLATDELASFVRKPIDLAGLLVVLDGLLAVRESHRLRRDTDPSDPVRRRDPVG